MKYLFIALLFLFGSLAWATPMQEYKGVSYVFNMILPCVVNGDYAKMPISEVEELNATRGLVEGTLSGSEFAEIYLEHNPQLRGNPAMLRMLHNIIQACEGSMKRLHDDQSKSGA